MRISFIFFLLLMVSCSSKSTSPSLEGDLSESEDGIAREVMEDGIGADNSVSSCKPGQSWCEGESIVRCRADGMGTEVVNSCSSPAVCYRGACCTPYCDDLECGDDQCGGVCGNCSSGRHCEDGVCQDGACEAQCEGRECGPDGCGSVCGECEFGTICIAFLCLAPDSCVGKCDGLDCGYVGECNCGGCGAEELCVAHDCVDAEAPCAVECEMKECGVVGECDCGKCGDGLACDDGVCIPAMDPCFSICLGKACGMEGGCDCGTCKEAEMCVEGQCVEDPCAAVCEGVACGDSEGCDCGVCDGGFTCQENKCVPVTGPCVGFCAGKECGEVSGCSCGECGEGDYCTDDYKCECKPLCDGKMCGDDGCGGACGNCEGGTVCTAAGLCFDPDCNIYQWEFTERLGRVGVLQFGDDGFPGHGLDVDENPATCAPKGKCSQGIDNEMGGSLAGVPGIGNPSDWLQDAITEGKVHLLLEISGSPSGTWLNFLAGVGMDQGCPELGGSCTFKVAANSFDGYSCKPAMRLSGTSTESSFLVGSLDQSVTLPLPVAGGITVPLTLYRAHAKGTYTLSGGTFAITNGVLAGAILKSEFLVLLNAIPDGVLPVSIETIIGALDLFIKPDQDLDGDGTFDAYSVGFTMSAAGVPVLGVL